jgi:uncharacterized RDD family membrane protein YckC
MDMIHPFKGDKMEKKVSLLKRSISFFIDLYLGALLASIPISLISLIQINQITQNIFLLDKSIAIIAIILSFVCLGFYYLYIPLFIYPGQTLGKRLMDIQIIASSKISLVKRQIVFMLLFTSTSHLFAQLVSLLTGYNLISLMTDITLSLSLMAIINLFITKQMLYDRLAKTYITDFSKQKTFIKNQLREEK